MPRCPPKSCCGCRTRDTSHQPPTAHGLISLRISLWTTLGGKVAPYMPSHLTHSTASPFSQAIPRQFLPHARIQGFGQLHSLGLSFDLQANPSQLLPFASNYSKIPDAPVVIIDHMSVQPFSFSQTSALRRRRSNCNTLACMGTPQIDGAQDQVSSFRSASCFFHALRIHAIPQKSTRAYSRCFFNFQTYNQWLQGMQALSRFPRVFCKLSMLTHAIHVRTTLNLQFVLRFSLKTAFCYIFARPFSSAHRSPS
jgi:hypothetical protein